MHDSRHSGHTERLDSECKLMTIPAAKDGLRVATGPIQVADLSKFQNLAGDSIVSDALDLKIEAEDMQSETST